MDRYKVVHRGYHGMRSLPRRRSSELYHEKRIRPHTPRYHWIDTLFALSEVTSVRRGGRRARARGETVDYDKLFARRARRPSTRPTPTGTVYGWSRARPRAFMERDPELARALHKLRSAGKKLFLLTNSPLLVHRADDDVPARRRHARVPVLAALLRVRAVSRTEAALVPGRPPAHGARRRRS